MDIIVKRKLWRSPPPPPRILRDLTQSKVLGPPIPYSSFSVLASGIEDKGKL